MLIEITVYIYVHIKIILQIPISVIIADSSVRRIVSLEMAKNV